MRPAKRAEEEPGNHPRAGCSGSPPSAPWRSQTPRLATMRPAKRAEEEPGNHPRAGCSGSPPDRWTILRRASHHVNLDLDLSGTPGSPHDGPGALQWTPTVQGPVAGSVVRPMDDTAEGFTSRQPRPGSIGNPGESARRTWCACERGDSVDGTSLGMYGGIPMTNAGGVRLTIGSRFNDRFETRAAQEGLMRAGGQR